MSCFRERERAGEEAGEDPRSEAWIGAGGCPSPPPISAHGERVMRTRAEKAASGPAAEGEGEGESTASAIELALMHVESLLLSKLGGLTQGIWCCCDKTNENTAANDSKKQYKTYGVEHKV